VSLLQVVDGHADIEIDCTPPWDPELQRQIDAMSRFHQEYRGLTAAAEKLRQVPNVNRATWDSGLIIVNMRVDAHVTCGEMYRLREILQIIVRDAMTAAIQTHSTK
jgi:hypothetical protein